jgi:hypothetical protein
MDGDTSHGPGHAFHLTTTPQARRAGPREHGRQAARSKRDRPGGQVSRPTTSATSAPPQAARLSTPGMGDRLGVEVPWGKRWC